MEKQEIMKQQEKFLFIRAAAIIIKDNKLLTARNAGSPHYTIGGRIEINETSEEAVIREIYEETGYTLEIDRLVYINERFIEVDGQKCHEIVFYYLMKNNIDINIQDGCFTDQAPTETLHWLPIDSLAKTDLVPPFLRIKSFDDIVGIEHIISKEY